MIIYSNNIITKTALNKGLVTIDATAQKNYMNSIFDDEHLSYEVTMLFNGQSYPAILRNVQRSKGKVIQVNYGSDLRGALKGFVDENAPSVMNMWIIETENPLIYKIECLPQGIMPGETVDLLSFGIPDIYISVPEGKAQYKTHKQYERSPLIAREAKRRFAASHNGQVYCEICGFNFNLRYGQHGKDYIEVHHIIPVSELGDNASTTVDDLCLVCSNCHRMIHRTHPWLSIEKMREIIQQ